MNSKKWAYQLGKEQQGKKNSSQNWRVKKLIQKKTFTQAPRKIHKGSKSCLKLVN